MRGKLCLNAGGVSHQDKPHLGMANERNRGSSDHDARSVVPAHGVERYGDWRTHFPQPNRKDCIGRGRMTATPQERNPNRRKCTPGATGFW
jgi:hypothetical protein